MTLAAQLERTLFAQNFEFLFHALGAAVHLLTPARVLDPPRTREHQLFVRLLRRIAAPAEPCGVGGS
jgi:hypothetical protein